MNNIIDLSKRLTPEKPKIKIDAKHEYEVKNNKNVAILISEIAKDEKIKDLAREGDKTDKVIEAALGKDALEYLKTLDLSVGQWSLIVEAIVAQINEIPLEEVEKQTDKEKDNKIKAFRK